MKFYKIFSIWEYLTVAFFILTAVFLLLFYLNNNSLNDKGIIALQNKDFQTAQKYFQKNVESGFLDDRPYLNLGLSYDLLNQPLKAFEIYKIVSSSKNRSLGAFFSYFNQAELYGRLGNLEKAIQNYQSALGFKQKEKEIKTNIELLFKDNRQGGSGKSESDSKNQSNHSNKDSSKDGKEDEKRENSDKNPSEENTEDEKGDSSDKDSPEENTEDKKGDSSDKDSPEENTEDEKGDSFDKDSLEENTEDKKGDSSDKDSPEENTEEKVFTERDQAAIFEEVQQQENKVRARFYQNKKVFGDKTGQDW